LGASPVLCPRAGTARGPGFPLQVLGFAYANPAGFPLQSLARAPAAGSSLKTKFTAKPKTGKGEEVKKGNQNNFIYNHPESFDLTTMPSCIDN
jgi:hypothetical protein